MHVVAFCSRIHRRCAELYACAHDPPVSDELCMAANLHQSTFAPNQRRARRELSRPSHHQRNHEWPYVVVSLLHRRSTQLWGRELSATIERSLDHPIPILRSSSLELYRRRLPPNSGLDWECYQSGRSSVEGVSD